MPNLVQKEAQRNTYAIPSGANVLFAAPNGSISTTGRDVSQPVTLTRALNLANSAATPQTIVLRGGVYTHIQNSELNKPGTVLMAYGSEFPVISGFRNVSNFTLVNGVYEAPYTNVIPNPITDTRALNPNNQVVKNLQMVLLGDTVLTQVGDKALVVAGKFNYYIDPGNAKIFVSENPAPFGGVDTVGAEFGLRLNAANQQLRGIGIMGYVKGFRINGTSGVIIDRVTARYFSLSGANASPASNSVMSNTELGYCGMACYDGGGVQTTIEDCDIHHGNTSDGKTATFNVGWSSGGIKLTSNLVSTNMNCTVRRNKVYSCRNAGIWIDINVHDQVIHSNEVWDCVIGIEDEISQRNAYVNNYIHDCGVGFLISCTEAAEVWYNTIENCNTAIKVQDWGRDRSNTESQNPGNGIWKTKATVISSNLVIAKDRPAQYSVVTDTYQTEVSSTYVSSMTNNLYVKAGNLPAKFIQWSGTSQDVQYATLDTFKAAFPNYEQGSSEVASLPVSAFQGATAPPRVAAVLGASIKPVGAISSTPSAPPPPPTKPEDLESRIASLESDLQAMTNERDRLANDNLGLTSRVSTLSRELDEAKAASDVSASSAMLALDKLERVKRTLSGDVIRLALDIIG